MKLHFEKNKISIGKDGNGAICVDVPDVDRPLPLDRSDLLSAKAELAANEKWSWGGDVTAKLALKGDTSCRLLVLSNQTAVGHAKEVDQYGLGPFLATSGPVLLLEVGAGGNVNAEGSFRYGALTGGVTLEAGAEGSAAWARPFDAQKNAGPVLEDFFQQLRLPDGLEAAPKPGEVTVLEYSGDLKLGASVGAGFEAKGTATADLGTMKLTEHYKCGAVGKLAIQGGVSGRFTVEVRRAEAEGKPWNGWARVVVKRNRSHELKAAAHLSMEAHLVTEGLPTDPKVFFGALFGVQVGSWLTTANAVFSALTDVNDLPSLEGKLDGLTKDLVTAWLGKRIPELIGVDGEKAFRRVQALVKDYKAVDEQAIALFDAYYEKGPDWMLARLGDIQNATSWDSFRGQVDPSLWDIVERLTNGDPLSWMIGAVSDATGTRLLTLADLKEKAEKVAKDIQTLAHGEIEGFIKHLKEEFGMDALMTDLEEIDSPEKVAQLSGEKAGHFLARIVGRKLDATLSTQDKENLFNTVQDACKAWETAESDIGGLLEKVASQDVNLELAAEYARSDEKTVLVNAAFNLGDERGMSLFRAAAAGDFSEAFGHGAAQTGVWRLNQGTFARALMRRRTFTFNILGWHEGFKYQNVSEILTGCKQTVLPGEGGALIVRTDLSGTASEDIKKNDEERHARFTLALAAQMRPDAVSSGYDAATQSFLVELVKAKSVDYDLRTVDAHTTPDELKQYLAFGQTLGIGSVEALYGSLAPLLPWDEKRKSFGKVIVVYQVKFTTAAVERIFSSTLNDAECHHVLGPIVLGRYAGDGSLAPAGWAFAMNAGKKQWPNDFDLFLHQGMEFQMPAGVFIPPSFNPPLNQVRLSDSLARLLDTLYWMEKSNGTAWNALVILINSPMGKEPKAIAEAIDQYFKEADNLMFFSREPNFLFAFFDGVARLGTPANVNHASRLLVSFKEKEGQDRAVMFLQTTG